MKARKKLIELVYIGDRFYSESGTTMSSIYKYDKRSGQFSRYDYGFLQYDLGYGCSVVIRQASPNEMKFFESELIRLKGLRK